MLKSIILVISILTISFTSISQGTNEFNTKWSNGYKISNKKKGFDMKFGGRIMWDNAIFFQDEDVEALFGKINNGAEFRRLRFFNSGTIYHNVKYKMQLDFAGGKVVVKDMYISLKNLGLFGDLKVGHFKEPLRLEALTSSKYITFLERSFPSGMIPERNTGIMLSDHYLGKKLSLQFGLFRRADGSGNDKKADDGYALTSRISGILVKNKEKRQLLHVGIGYSYRKPKTDEFKISARAESHLGHKYVSTGSIENVANINVMNFETALVMKAFSLQGEYMITNTVSNASVGKDYSFNSYYAQLSYFLTGESRKYKSSLSGFSRVKPMNNFNLSEKTYGAFELALRYSAIDLTDEDVTGGQLSDVTIGLNWYLNPATRIMTNYVMANIKDVGNAHIVQMRFQVDF